MSLSKKFKEFENMYGLDISEPDMQNLISARHLIEDEVTEFDDEIVLEPDLKLIAKEMTDIIYITGERMTNFGFDVDSLLEEVHRSNMSKRVSYMTAEKELETAKQRYPNAYLVQLDQPDYMVIKDASTGKVVKPTCYSPAKITPEMLGYPNTEVLNNDN